MSKKIYLGINNQAVKIYDENESSATLIEKSIDANGTYIAKTDDNADGYSKVTVNVSSGGGVHIPLSIYVATPPAKTTYLMQDTIDLTGMVVKAQWSDGTETDITNSIQTVPANGETITTIYTKIRIYYNYIWSDGNANYETNQPIEMDPPEEIYGVSWSSGQSPIFTRTDDAASFSNPAPALGTGTGSSPFDSILPWAGMVRSNNNEAGEVVAIPKYYFKWTIQGTSTYNLQISMKEFNGSHVSPAHADRDDGRGERDIVYVGRYHCGDDYKSKAGVMPFANITRSAFRSGIHNLGTTVWQYDYAMYWTIAMLYLVEFANWGSQETIGYGCSPNDSIENVGGTDTMQYHTGTTAASRTTYGWTQYRNIEGLWDNVYDFCDGIYFSGNNTYAIKTPALFSDNEGGTQLYTTRFTSSRCINQFYTNNISGYEYALRPNSTVSGSYYSKYMCDTMFADSGGQVLAVGGSSSQNMAYGLFCQYSNLKSTYKSQYYGSRLMVLP